jgi:hypothetical protein
MIAGVGLFRNQLSPKAGLVEIACESSIVHGCRLVEDPCDGQYGLFVGMHAPIVSL